MAFNKNKVQEISEILESTRGEYIGQTLSQENIELVEKLTIGDVILEFGFNVDDASQVLNNIVLVKRKNAAIGFTANVVKESKKIRESYEYDAKTMAAFKSFDIALNSLMLAGVPEFDVAEIVATAYNEYERGGYDS